MKKQLLLLSGLVMTLASFAQSTPTFGIRAGITSSSLSGDAVNSLQNILDLTKGMVEQKSRTGFFAGVNTSIPLSEAVSFSPGIYYAQKGYEVKGSIGIKGLDFLGANAKADLVTHYVDVPLLMKVNLSGFEIFAGPQLSYLAKADLKTTAGILGFNLLNKKFDATDQFNRWDAAATAGVGYHFQNGVSLNASYDYGLSRADANKNLNAYNRSVKVGIGYNF